MNFIPKEFFVARVSDDVFTDTITGFMVTTNKTGFVQRKKTALSWCGDSNTLEPIMVPNTPMRGFSLYRNTQRHGTKNVVWRVLHPYGFEFEITSDNFSDFLLEVDIKEGIIQTEMAFVRRGSENYLTHTKSDVYMEAITQDQLDIPTPIKDVAIGDVVTLKNGITVIYRGMAHCMMHEGGNRIKPKTIKSSRRYFFNEVGCPSNKLICFSSPVIVKHEPQPKGDRPLTNDTLLPDLKERIKLHKYERDDTFASMIAVHSSEFSVNDLVVEHIPLSISSCGTVLDVHANINNTFSDNNIVIKLVGDSREYYAMMKTHNKFNSGIFTREKHYYYSTTNVVGIPTSTRTALIVWEKLSLSQVDTAYCYNFSVQTS